MDRLVKMSSGDGYFVEADGQKIGMVLRHVRHVRGGVTASWRESTGTSRPSWWAYVRSEFAPSNKRSGAKVMGKTKDGSEIQYIAAGSYPSRGAAVRKVFRVANV